MRRPTQVLTLTLLAATLTLPRLALAERQMGGEVQLRTGKARPIDAFGDNLRLYDYVMARDKEEQTFIPLADVVEIQLLDPDADYVFDSSKVSPKSGEMVVILRDGTSHHFQHGYFRDKEFTARLDKGKEEKIAFADCARIRFINHRVQLLHCPKCDQEYGSPYAYCPVDGAKLAAEK
ncbi:MAG: hypothetical protein COW73_02730 [Nitrospirae bacterium CG18_big_fil_WC_8_21_14_2_50_70_55]|nr:hypothetical protein [Deltaproteobacteria bacterium]OIP63969.1 MAG: hypothetical protein AUK30_07500 [Nitrospirae bacterium CG2_30_70_394]PIQ06676.1 MAG: hypothetical protein COW73_02730 [Nitrospirae bacterium CG18_big_fil_WC_8_21_14_2_50_70_55]PIU77721.1 MAG: hypothetical protein COS73_09205 [Nitrospirae bacterium CG06_land_8_20_14_3_00_70_43]PIW82566.1 MAG: hypothetical protein COZ96_08115 [Nitrospirae bacterium CG_4_8_14_3_um_filter_70_85]PIX83783.1 MAG: hypothetical protein COZ33_03530 